MITALAAAGKNIKTAAGTRTTWKGWLKGLGKRDFEDLRKIRNSLLATEVAHYWLKIEAKAQSLMVKEEGFFGDKKNEVYIRSRKEVKW
jgi:hypothetical protein